ncbi:MAG: glycosyltransferase [Deltaproteobacteria bacterium]|nr:glycosyltransferase [Deltaproteobacteria bacterium]
MKKHRIQIISFSDFERDNRRRLRWGDYWFKYELKKEFEKLGHIVCDNNPDILIHLFGVPINNLPEAPYKIVWIHSHPDLISPKILDQYDQIYCLSPIFLEKIKNWGFQVKLLIGGTSKSPVKSHVYNDVVFVGNTKGPTGRKIIRDLGNLNSFPYRLKVWGEGWKDIIPSKFYNGIYFENQNLGGLYASSLVSLNDHHDDMRSNGFINPRILDILASGGFCISDNIIGLEMIFQDIVPRYKTNKELRELIDFYISNPQKRLKMVDRGIKIASSYSFSQMIKQILNDIEFPKTSQEGVSLFMERKSQFETVKLDLGCGKLKREGFIGLDVKAMPGVDIVCDISQGIPIKNDCADYIIADNLMEHIGDEFIDVMNNIWDICKIGAILKIVVPGAHTSAAFQDPTHKRFFVKDTFDYFNIDHERWKIYGSSYGIKPFRILSSGLRSTDQRFIEVEMTPIKEKKDTSAKIKFENHQTTVPEKMNNGNIAKNVLVSFGFVPHSTAAYLIRALKQKGQNVRSCGPLNKPSLLKCWSNHQLTRLVPLHDIVTESDTSIIDVINSFQDNWHPDLFLWVESSMNYPNFPKEIGKLDCPTAGYFIDSHTKINWHLEFAKQFDYVFIAQKAYIHNFIQAGCKRVSWLPLACDPEIHGKHQVEKRHDISFVGNLYSGVPLYQKRNYLLNILQKKYDVKIEQKYFNEMAESFSKAKFVFNISAKDDLNMRVFEALASGTLLFTDQAKGSGLTELFRNREDLIIYKNENDLLELVDYYLSHPEEAEDISSNGLKKVKEYHTYSHRIDNIIKTIGKTQNETEKNVKIISPVPHRGVSKLPEKQKAEKDNITVEYSGTNSKTNKLRILAAFAHFNWEDHNLQPALEEIGEVIRLRWPPYNQYDENWHFSKKQWFNIQFLKEIVEAHATKPIDVFFGYVSGRLLFPSTIREIERMGIPSISMCLDDRTKFFSRLEPTGYAGMVDIASSFSLCWTSTEDAIKYYESVGARAIYLPEGANPKVYRPLELPFDIDVSFIGQCYGERPRIIKYLAEKGIIVKTFGKGWPSGTLPVEEMVNIYNRSRINIGFSAVGDSSTLCCLKGRDFEVPMSGGLYLTQYHPELENVYHVGKEILCYHDVDDLAKKIQHSLAHPEISEEIRNAAYHRAIKEHTWVDRFKKAFEKMDLPHKTGISHDIHLQGTLTNEPISQSELTSIIQQGEAFFLSGHLREAKKHFEKALSIDPNNLDALNNQGVIAYSLNDFDQAISLLKNALAIDSNHMDSIQNLGKCFETKDDYGEALKWFEKALHIGGESTKILNHIGNCHTQANDLENAIKAYASSLRLDGSQDVIKRLLTGLESANRALIYQTVYSDWEAQGRPVPPPDLVKQEIVRSYAQRFSPRILIETGTYLGAMVYAMKDSFKEIYSIELDHELAQRAKELFSPCDHIHIIEGDSGHCLSALLSSIEKPCLFWLDGHYSGGITAKGEWETPIMQELKCIFDHPVRNHIILIDDARCFTGEQDYPSLEKLKSTVLQRDPDLNVELKDDIIRIHKVIEKTLTVSTHERAGTERLSEEYREHVENKKNHQWSAPFTEVLLRLFEKYGPELGELKEIERYRHDTRRFPTSGQYDLFESQVLYMILRDKKPENVIEFSSNCGYSTLFIASALRRNNTGHLHSFEIVPDFSRIAQKNAEYFGLRDRVTFNIGDIKETLEPYIRERLRRPPDLLFIDSDHSSGFARWYVRNLFPLLRVGTLIHIHDMLPPDNDLLIQNGPKVNTCRLSGENIVLEEALRKGSYVYDREYIYLHDLTFRNDAWVNAVRNVYPDFVPYRQGKAEVVRRMNREGVLTEWNATLWFRYVKPLPVDHAEFTESACWSDLSAHARGSREDPALYHQSRHERYFYVL